MNIAALAPKPDRGDMKGLVFGTAALSLVVIAGLVGAPILEQNQRRAEMMALRAALDGARISAESCKTILASEQEDFLRFDGRVDSLRSEMESYEDPDQGGVPQASYREYLGTFDRYNTAVESWNQRAESLQASEARCRALVEAHNRLGDSIRRIQDGARGRKNP